MSTATTIQAHIAYEVIDSRDPAIELSDLRDASYAANSKNDEAKSANRVTIRSAANGATVDPALTLDDFGGKSDALGG